MPPFDGSGMAPHMKSSVRAQNDLSSAALKAVCEMLESPEMEKLWALHHHSRAEENIPVQIAAEIRENMSDMEARPDLQSFIAEFLLAEIKASADPAVTGLRSELMALRAALWQPPGTGTYAARRILPDDYRQVIDMIDVQMQQKPFRYFLRDIATEYVEHIKEGAQKHPYAFTGFLAACAGAGVFMKTSLGPAKTYIDPQFAGIAFDENGIMTGVSVSADLAGLKFGCHNHISSYIGEEAASIIESTLGSFGITHCSAIMNLDIKAQNALQTSYNFIKMPFDAVMGIFVKNPLSDFGTEALQNSSFAAAYNAAATSVSEAVYALNTVENIVLHSVLFSAAMIEGYRQSGPGGGHEARETLTAAKDFFYRTLHDRSLSYVFPAVASGAVYMAQGQFDGSVVLAGAGGAVAGHIAHNLKHVWERKTHVTKVTENVRDMLRDFREAAKEKGIVETLAEPARKQWLSAKEKMTWAGASLSAYATIVFADVSGYAQALESDLARESILKGSEILGAATATGLIAGFFVPFNIVEDAAQHIIFGVGGYGAGRAYGGVVSAKEKFLLSGPR